MRPAGAGKPNKIMADSRKPSAFISAYRETLNVSHAAARTGLDLAYEVPGGFYVYLLADPRDGSLFYVGKGRGSRMHAHVRAARVGNVDNAPKFRRIREILDAGERVQEFVFAACGSEREALMVEGELIHGLRDLGLTNIAGGCASNNGIRRELARHAFEQLLSFDEWMRVITPKQLGYAEVLGGQRAVYNMVYTHMEKRARPDADLSDTIFIPRAQLPTDEDDEEPPRRFAGVVIVPLEAPTELRRRT